MIGTKAITNHLRKVDLSPASLWAMPPFPEQFSPSVFIAEHDFIFHEIPLWHIWVSTLCCVPSRLLAYTQPTQWEDRMEGVLSNSQNTGVLSALLVTNPKQDKIQNRTIRATMKWIHPCQPDLVQSPVLIPYHFRTQFLHYPTYSHQHHPPSYVIYIYIYIDTDIILLMCGLPL